jgi:hypothetical protein
MTPDELDTAIRDELRTQARRAPAGAPVRARVLEATRTLPLDEEQPRGLRAWLVPMLAAAVVLLVTLGVTAGPKLLHSDGPGRTPPAGTSPKPAPSAAPSSITPQHWWYQHVDAGALPHTPGLCPQGLTAGPLPARLPWRPGQPDPELPVAQAVSVPGEPEPLWLLPVTCNGLTDGSHPIPVEVFRYRPDGPQLVQTLAYQPGDQRSIIVNSIEVTSTPGELFLNQKGYAPTDPLCCRNLRFSQQYTWQQSRSRYVAGPEVVTPEPVTTPACTDAQLEVTQSPLSGPGDSRGILLRYVNTGPKPCELDGYPHAAVVDATGRLLAEANPTPTPTGTVGRLVDIGATSEPSGPLGSWWAVIEWESVESDGAQCYPHARLESTPPGTTATRAYGDLGRVCYLQVHPVMPGDTGSK